MGNYRTKPLREESIYKHLCMLAGYCAGKASDEDDGCTERRKAFLSLSKKLHKLSNSKEVWTLQQFGE